MTELQQALLAGAIDYAGLFPPARLEMDQAVANYRRYLAGEHRWALGRFVCPVGRLEEFAAARRHGGEAWHIAAVASGEPHEEAAAIARFNQDHYGRALVDSIEARTPAAAAVHTRVAASSGLQCFCELNPSSPEFASTAAAVRQAGAHAKLRTGGVTPDVIPSPDAVALFLETCHSLGLAFKATAGLHHPIRGLYPLTYEPDAPQALMYGFLNLLVASAAVLAGADRPRLLAILTAEDPWPLAPDPRPLAASPLRRFFLSFGSCSFEEPLACLPPLP